MNIHTQKGSHVVLSGKEGREDYRREKQRKALAGKDMVL